MSNNQREKEYPVRDGITMGSDEEAVFYDWLVEAQDAGIVTDFIFQPTPIQVFDKQTYTMPKQLKTKVRYDERVLTNRMTYTPDFKVWGTIGKFHKSNPGGQKMLDNIGRYYLENYPRWFFIDTKATYGMHGGDDSFSMKQKVIWNCQGIWINKVIPEKFFENSWLPMPITKKKDLIWTDEHVYKDGRLKPQKRRKKYEKCIPLEAKGGLI